MWHAEPVAGGGWPVEVLVQTVQHKRQQLLSILLLEAIELRSTPAHGELREREVDSSGSVVCTQKQHKQTLTVVHTGDMQCIFMRLTLPCSLCTCTRYVSTRTQRVHTHVHYSYNLCIPSDAFWRWDSNNCELRIFSQLAIKNDVIRMLPRNCNY